MRLPSCGLRLLTPGRVNHQGENPVNFQFLLRLGACIHIIHRPTNAISDRRTNGAHRPVDEVGQPIPLLTRREIGEHKI